MRIIHVITRLIVGGAQENTVTSVIGLGKVPSWRVSLISGPSRQNEGTLRERFADNPAALLELPSLVRSISPFHDLRAYCELRKIFSRERPLIVHTHSGKAGIIGRLAAAKAGVPVIIHSIHGPSFGDFQGLLANGIFTAAERLAARRTTQFIVVADAMRKQYLAMGISSPEKYTLIRSGFDLRPFLQSKNDPKLRQEFGLKPEDFVVGKVARLVKLKGHAELLEMSPELVAKIPNIKFLLIGDGPLRQQLQTRIAHLGLASRFVFAGLVLPESVPPLVGIMDVLVHLSRREGLPRALPQALAAAKPVVAFDCDGAGEVCLNHQTGFLVPPGDNASLCSALATLARDPQLRDRLGGAGREIVSAQFDEKKMIDKQRELYLALSATADWPGQ